MDISVLPSEEQRSIETSVRKLLDDRSAPSRLMTLAAGSPVRDQELWDAAADQGVFILTATEADGGVGLTLREQTIAFSELGRALVAGPYLGTTLAAELTQLRGAEVAVPIGQGEVPVGLAVDDGSGRFTTFDADDAQAWLVLGREGEAAFYEPTAVRAGPTRLSVDFASRLAQVEITDEPVCSVRPSEYAVLPRLATLAAAMLSGIADATRDISVAHAKVREQFGVPIGAFQAVKHRCAEQAVRAEAAARLYAVAASAISQGAFESARYWPAAYALNATYALENCMDLIQNLGAIGYTDEHVAHLYLKRAQLLGTFLDGVLDVVHVLNAAPDMRPA